MDFNILVEQIVKAVESTSRLFLFNEERAKNYGSPSQAFVRTPIKIKNYKFQNIKVF
jgi:hypothetical protein